jgi:Fic family protein
MAPKSIIRWNWQQPDWPHFRFDGSRLTRAEEQFLMQSGILVGVFKHLDSAVGEQLRLDLLGNEALLTSEIEGEILNRESLQSSLRKAFGLQANSHRTPPKEQGVANMMVALYRTFGAPLDNALLFDWHHSLMADRTDLETVGAYRTHADAMQIVSGRLDRPTVHFEAPPSTRVTKEMNQYVTWFNRTAPAGDEALPAITRAGVAHLYFESIHPFEDGNGRIGRALSEKALAQSLQQPTLLSLADAIKRRQKEYYLALQQASRGLDITEWLVWFSGIVTDAQNLTRARAEFLIFKAKLFDRLRDQLNARQEKALLRLFREGPDGFKGGLSADNYRSITGASPATVTRDLQDLVEKGALKRTGEHKGTRYFLPIST